MAQTIKLKRSGTSGAVPTTSQLELGEVAINTYDGKMYIKKNVGGTESIVEISAASADAILVEYQFTATAGQSTFSGSDDNSETLSYTPNAIQVFLNGILLDPGIDFTATNSTSIVLSETVDANDYLQVFAFKKKIGDGNVSVDTFTGDNSTTAFTLTVDPGDENNTRVFIDGVYQSKANYSVSGTTLTFSTAPPTGTAVEVEIGNRVVTLDTLSDLDLPDDVKLRLGTDQDLQIYHDGSNGFIKNTTGDLYIEDTNGSIRIRPKTGESGINVLADSSVELYYDNSKKLETSNDGVTVTGDIEATGEIIGDLRGATLFKAQAGEALTKGEVVYISGVSGNTTVVSKADADDASKMPAFGLVAASASSGNPVDIYTAGILADIDTSSFSEGDELFVSTTAGALTATAPTGESAALQKIGKVTRSDATGGRIFIIGAGRSNATPNLDSGDIFIGNASNQAVSASLNTKIEDYLDGGTSTPTFAGLTTTADVSFGDSDKAIFGAGSDLQIYHDGSNSYIGEFGTGSLRIRSNQVRLEAPDSQNMVIVTEDAGVQAFYNGTQRFQVTNTGINVTGSVTADAYNVSSGGIGTGYQLNGGTVLNYSGGNVVVGDLGAGVVLEYSGSTKLATTSTGIDVTGTAVTDGLTVDGVARLDNYGSTTGKGLLQFGNSGHQFIEGYDTGNAGSGSYLRFGYGSTEAMRIDSNGRVGIGTASPNGNGQLTINSAADNSPQIVFSENDTQKWLIGHRHDGDHFRFYDLANSAERMRIDSSGNLLIGTTSTSTQGLTSGGGIVFSSAGAIAGAYESVNTVDPVLSLNNTGADGSIVTLKKDGTTFGKLANDSTSLVVTSASTGLKFGSAAIWPTTGGGVANSNGAKDLGASTVKFKDFYLSGYAYVGALKTNASIESVSNLTFWVANLGEAARIEQGTGNIGVGTSAPSFSAVNSVSSGIKGIEIFKNGTDTASAIKLAGDNGSGTKAFAQIGYSGANATAHFANFNTSGTQVGEIVIGSTGNVGIGDTNPQTALHVKSSFGSQVRIQETGGTYWDLSGGGRFDIEDSSGNVKISLAQSGNPLIAPITVNTSSEVGMGKVASGHRLDVNGSVNATNFSLEEISTSNSDTAVDVFVYDTRKDSDGGAWRKRTQNTSWYNETLNTSTRGSRREFPCVAVIVTDNDATDPRVRIYDGDDPNMPLWMEFFGNQTADLISGGAGVIGPVTALNGIVCVGATTQSSSGAGGIKIIDFISDRASQRTNKATGSQIGYYMGNLEQRNDALSYGEEFGTAGRIVGIIVNDIAMTVLPNAPIDADTGLPVPTIAVATPGGISVIKDDGTVVDITAGAGSSYNGVSWIDITENNYLIFEQDSSNRSVFHIPIPTSDRTTQTSDGSITDKVILKFYTNGSHEPYPVFNGVGVIGGTGMKGNNQALRGSNNELTLLEPDISSPEQGKVAYIASDYNTGWMLGNIKLAALSSTSTVDNTDYVGGAGTFANASDWSTDSQWSVSGGTASYSGSGPAYISRTPTSNFVYGNWYYAELDVTSGGAGTLLLVNRHISGIVKPYTNGLTNVDVGFIQLSGTKYFAMWKQNSNNQSSISLYATQAVTVDNFKVYEIAAHDRSANNKHLIKYGTINSSAVATGAELTGYYGWGGNNYFEQPYTGQLNFGAGDFCMMWWQKKDALTGSTAAVPIEFSNPDVDIDGTPSALVYEYLNRVRFYTRGTSGGWHFIEEPTNLIAGVWQCYAVVRRGGIKEIWRNGKLAKRDTATDDRFVTSTSTILRVGKRSDGAGSPFDGMISLVRVSATAPSEEQIAKMYNDEKHLFAENAKATLYDSTDAVAALAYDNDTELLHVGTSAGRSVFQGLNRVDNTTDAVGTAISASGGFIVEE